MPDISRNEINSNFYQIVETDANGNILYVKSEFVPASNAIAGGSNGAVQFNSNNVISGSNGFTFDSNTNTVTASSFAGSGTELTNILATNIDGTVANATYAITAGTVDAVSGGNVIGPVSEANTAFSVSGANVVGSVANAVYADTAGTVGTVTTNAQPNITSVGTMTSVDVTGNVSAGAVKTDSLLQANGTPYVFTTNAAGSNTQVQFNNAGSFGANSYFTYDISNTKLTLDSSSVANANTSIVVKKNVANATANATSTITIDSNIAVTRTGTTAIIQPYITGFNVNALALTATSVGSNLVPTSAAAAYSLGGGSQTWANVFLTTNAQVRFGSIPLQGNSTTRLELGNTATFIANNINAFNTITATNFSGNGGNLSNIQAGNISGTVANATYATNAGTAYSVAGANVSGTVANATYADTAGSANSVAGANVSGEVANATYATTAGTAYSVSAANISGTVDLANFATTANSVAVANVSGIGNISTVNLNGNGSQVLAGNGTWIGTVASATTAGTVTTTAQPNITSVGSLVSLDVDGDIVGHANITGDYILGNGAFLTGVGDFSAAQGYHGSFFSNVNQTIASTTTAYPITLNNTSAGTYGIAVTSNSRITMTYAGTYNIQYSIQFTNTDTNIHDASVWLRKNGVNVPDTNSVYAVTARRLGINGQLIGAINYIVDANANDYYELIWQAESTSVSLEYIAPGTTPTSPATPSAIVTAMQVTNVQAATLSGNLTGNLVGNTYGFIGVGFINVSGNIQGDHFSGNASGLIGIVGANVTGQVSYAAVANSVAGANVSGEVANATYAANAGYATVSASTYSVDGSNVSGAVANATYSVSANTANIAYSVSGANVSGEVANATYANISGEAYSVAIANVSGIGNIASINLDGNVSNVLAGDGTWISNDTGTPTSLNADIGNVQIQGGNVSQIIITDGAGNLSFITAGVVATSADPYYLSYNAGANGCGYDNTIPGGDPIIFFNYTPDATDFMSKVPFTFILDDHLNTGIRFSINALSITTSYPYDGGTAVGITCTSTELGSAIGSGPNNYVIATEGILSLIPTRLAASVANVAITGGNINDVLKTDGNGVLSWTALPASNSISNGNSNITIANTDGNIRFHRNSELAFSIDDTAIYAYKDMVVYGNVFAANFSVSAVGITFADSTVQTTAASGNIVTINLDGNVSNVLAGDGTWITVNNVANANYANIAGEAYSVSGANVFGAVAYAAVANSVSGANVSGDVSSAIVAGTAYSVSGGNVSGEVANATFATTAGSADSVAGANVTGEVANATFATTAGSADFVAGANVTGEVANATFATTAGSADSVAGANVSGEVAFAATANSVAGANVSGDVSSAIVAGTAYSVSGANVSGAVANATFATTAGSADSVAGVNVSGTVANATYAVNAGTAYSVSGANVSGTVANATYAVSAGSASTADVANSVAGANVSGTVANATYAVSAGSATVADSANSVAVANVTGIGNIAVINLNGNGSQVLAGNGVFIAQSGGGGTPGGANTELQFNNNGSFGGISTVTYNGTNISLGAVTTIKITGGANAQVLSTDGTGNLSWVAQSGGGGGTETFAPFLLAGM